MESPSGLPTVGSSYSPGLRGARAWNGNSSPLPDAGSIITSSAAIVDGRVYFGGGRTLYSLAADDGHLLWKHVICGNPERSARIVTSDQNDPLQILSSPAVFAGTIYVGVTTGGVDFGIPYRGGFLAFDTETGEQRWRFEVDPEAGAKYNFKIGNAATFGPPQHWTRNCRWCSSERRTARNSRCPHIMVRSLRLT